MMTLRSPVEKTFPLLALLSVFGCSDSSAPTSDGPGVSFSYAGTLSGHFRAVGPANDALDPTRSFAVAFRSAAGELQLCAYQAGANDGGDFLLLNAGPATGPGEYAVPPDPVPAARSYQPGTFLVGVDAARTSVEHISTFTEGSVRLDQVSTTSVRGTFTVTSRLTELTDGRFDVQMTELEDLPVLCQ